MEAVLARNLAAVRDRIESAAARASRPAGSVELVAVTKSVEPPVAAALLALGQADLGENRVDELERKAAWMTAQGLSPRWHFVGHLQRNKARRVLRLTPRIHSVDTPALLQTLSRIACEEDLRAEVHLEVKLAPDPEKHGFDVGELDAAVALAASLERIALVGLMTMAPLEEGPSAAASARQAFASLRRAAEKLPHHLFAHGEPRLSMGMSGDFEIAVEEGAHVVRVGRVLFQGAGTSDRERAPRG